MSTIDRLRQMVTRVNRDREEYVVAHGLANARGEHRREVAEMDSFLSAANSALVDDNEAAMLDVLDRFGGTLAFNP